MQIEDICRQFTGDKILSVRQLGGGHINDTYLLETSKGKMVVQCIQKKMDISRLEYNYALYSGACDKKGLLYPVWIKNRSGGFFYTDAEGNRWRMYGFIEGEILDRPLAEKDFFACGQGLARLHEVFRLIHDIPKAVYPHLHDLDFFYGEYEKLLNSDDLSEENRDRGVEKGICLRIGEVSGAKTEDVSVIHGDTKLTNIIFREGKVAAFIDFDTMMLGSPLEDIADCIRSVCVTGEKLDKKAAEILVDGYTYMAGNRNSKDILSRLPAVFNRISFILALRYYTDSVSKEKEFKEKYPGYRHDRAKSLLNLFWD